MSAWTRRGAHVLVVLSRGNELLEGIRGAAREAAIESASFVGLGAVEQLRLAWYDRYETKYRESTLEGVWEIASLIGNVTRYEGVPRIHAHLVASDRSCHVRAGHLVGGVVAVTCEITFTPFDAPLERRLDDSFNIPLIDLASRPD